MLGDLQQVRIEADTRLNAIIVRDAPERLPYYEQLVQSLDVEPQSLEIEATIIDINTDKMRELGINWRGNIEKSSVLFGKGDASTCCCSRAARSSARPSRPSRRAA